MPAARNRAARPGGRRPKTSKGGNRGKVTWRVRRALQSSASLGSSSGYSVLCGIRPDSWPGPFGIRAAVADALGDLRNGLLWKVVSHLSPEVACVPLPRGQFSQGGANLLASGPHVAQPRARRLPCPETKLPKLAPDSKLTGWRVSLIRERGEYLGHVEAPDRERAEASACRRMRTDCQDRTRTRAGRGAEPADRQRAAGSTFRCPASWLRLPFAMLAFLRPVWPAVATSWRCRAG